MKVLVLGASGMLGNAVFRLFGQSPGYQVYGSVRSSGALRLLSSNLQSSVIAGVDVENKDNLTRLFAVVHPDVCEDVGFGPVDGFKCFRFSSSWLKGLIPIKF